MKSMPYSPQGRLALKFYAELMFTELRGKDESEDERWPCRDQHSNLVWNVPPSYPLNLTQKPKDATCPTTTLGADV